jgi:competence protein ComEC
MKRNKLILFISLILLILIFWWTLPSKKGKVVMCDVGQGDATLVIYKNVQLLVDLGPDNKKLLNCLDKHLPFWDKRIEIVILSHGDKDHVGGLDDLIRSYKVDYFFSNGFLEKDIEQKSYSKRISENDVISSNMFDFEVLFPSKNGEDLEDKNENSVVGILKWKGKNKDKGWSMFMGGDLDKEGEQRLVWRKIINEEVEILKVGHHGSKNSTSEELLKVLDPEVAIIGVGKNSYGHPSGEVLERLEKYGIEVKRTDLDGDIIFELE